MNYVVAFSLDVCLHDWHCISTAYSVR